MDVFFKTHDPVAGARQMEELVRADLACSSPVPYGIFGVQGAASKHPALSDYALRALGGRPTSLYSIEFELPGQRRALLLASMMRNADWAYCGSLAYSVLINRRIPQEIGFEKRKAVVIGPHFVGGEAAEKLNRVPGLTGRTNKILEESMFVATALLKQPPILRLSPADEGTWLLIRTLPVVKMGMRSRTATTNAGKVLQLAADIEAAL